MRDVQLIMTEFKLAQAHAQIAQMNAALADYQFREAQSDAVRLSAELRAAEEAMAAAAADNGLSDMGSYFADPAVSTGSAGLV